MPDNPNSLTAFRQWATSRLSELLVKGLTLDDEGRSIGADYIEERDV